MSHDIASEVQRLHTLLPQGVTLVAVSKFHPIEKLRRAYDAGQRVFGESRVQEMLTKIPEMPDDVRWHFIGHLQTNKVKSIIGHTALIESVDSVKLLNLIDRLSAEAGVVTRVLLQIHVAAEETKFGFTPDELQEYFRNGEYRSLRTTHICGLMGMATNTNDTGRIDSDFAAIASLHRHIIDTCPDLCGFDQLSMGMSDDYEIALRHGSTIVRIGTDIFGPREY